MAKRRKNRNALDRLFNKLFGREPEKTPPPKPKFKLPEPPKPPKRPPPPAPPAPPPEDDDPETLRRKTISKMMQMPLANRRRVRNNVDGMSPDEMRWTLKATSDDIRARARADADRLTFDDLPLNPWWYR